MSPQDIIALVESSKYVLLFAGSYIEGTVVMLLGGILWRLGQVQFWPAFGALLLGDILADLMWYAIGYFGARRFMERWGYIVNATPDVILKIERRFHTHHTWILIVSKLTMGFGLAVGTLMTAGMLRSPLSRYIMINLLGGIAWVYAVMLVGYYFGNVLAFIPTDLQFALAILVVVAAFFGLRALNARLAKVDW